MDSEEVKKQFDRVAERYDLQRRCFIPCFDDFYTRSVSLLRFFPRDFRRVLDLGAGTGLLTRELYGLYPEASFTLIDISGDMLQIARERFRGLPNFTFIERDYREAVPLSPCDLICSALSIHHLEQAEKKRVYKNSYAALEKNGCLINLDQFIEGPAQINALYQDWWYDYINKSGIAPEEKAAWRERKKLDKENTIDETLGLLKESGFAEAACIYRFMQFGVILAIK
jgi:tRNA (cmo5U34)-methyltransferase